MTLIHGQPRNRFGDREDVTLATYKATLAPIKAFRTRSGLAFQIVEAAS